MGKRRVRIVSGGHEANMLLAEGAVVEVFAFDGAMIYGEGPVLDRVVVDEEAAVDEDPERPPAGVADLEALMAASETRGTWADLLNKLFARVEAFEDREVPVVRAGELVYVVTQKLFDRVTRIEEQLEQLHERVDEFEHVRMQRDRHRAENQGYAATVDFLVQHMPVDLLRELTGFPREDAGPADIDLDSSCGGGADDDA